MQLFLILLHVPLLVRSSAFKQRVPVKIILAPFSVLTDMPKGIKKENLPKKDCVICSRPFTWRKKWERCWNEVTTCSKSCNAKRRELNYLSNKTEEGDGDELVGKDAENEEEDASRTVESSISKLEISTSTIVQELNERDIGSDNGSEIDGEEREKEIEGSIGENDSKAAKKVAKKAAKYLKRQKREGKADSTVGQKPCDMCSKKVDLLVRCQTDASQSWKMVCGKCWRNVSGGVADGDQYHPHYKYGGLWKNR